MNGTQRFETSGTNHPMTRLYVPEKMEITLFKVLNDTVLGIVDGLNDGFSSRCI